MSEIYSPLMIRNWCQRYMESWKPEDTPAEGYIGASIGMINNCIKISIKDKTVYKFKEDKKASEEVTADYRHLVYGWLFSPEDQPLQAMATGDLTDPMKYALYRWVKPGKPTEESKWQPRIGFMVECQWILNIARLVRTWTQDYERKDKVTYPLGSFIPAVAERLQDSVEAQASFLEPVGAAVALGGTPVKEGTNFLPTSEERLARPAQAKAWPTRQEQEPEIVATILSEGEKDRIMAWLQEHGKIVGQYANEDTTCANIITYYKLAYNSPGDKFAWTLLKEAIADYEAVARQ